MLEIKRAKVRFYIAFIIEYRYNEIEKWKFLPAME